jgi:hypothetical protein
MAETALPADERRIVAVASQAKRNEYSIVDRQWKICYARGNRMQP